MLRALDGVGGDDLAGLVGEQVDRVGGVVPQQVVDCYRVIGELAVSLEAQDGWS